MIVGAADGVGGTQPLAHLLSLEPRSHHVASIPRGLEPVHPILLVGREARRRRCLVPSLRVGLYQAPDEL